MQSVSSTRREADQKILMMIYRSLIRSKIVYGRIVNNSARIKELESLKSVSNEAMRISNGCFITTPISSLKNITEEPPLQIRKYKMNLKYYYKVKNLLENPTFKFVTPEQETICANRNSPPPFAIRIQKIHIIFNLKKKGLLPDFSYTRI